MGIMSRTLVFLETTGDRDTTKLSMLLVAPVSGVPCELEVFNIFAGLIPQECLARIDRHRQRQEMVPDMKITVTVGETSRPILHELKVISSSGSRYKPYWRKRAVDKIADDLHAEYVNKARKADQKHGGAEPGQ